jgi:hypothetical protein
MPTKDSSYSWLATTLTSQKEDGVEKASAAWSNGNSSVITRIATRTGVRQPKWRELIATGQDATTAMSAQYDTVRYNFGVANIRLRNSFPPPAVQVIDCVAYGAFPVKNGQLDRRPRSLTLDTSAVDNKAREKFYKELRKRSVQMSGPTFIGELRETLHQLRRPAQALWDTTGGYLSALRKEKRRSPRYWTKTISGLWLEYSFGWIPLLSDCKDAALAHRRIGKVPNKDMINVSFKDTKDTTSILDPLYDRGTRPLGGSTVLRYRTDANWVQEANVRYKAKLQSRVEMTTWDNFALFGFTPSEFIPTAWELLPWSFLADYFTNIGNLLSSYVTSTADVIYAVKTLRTDSRYSGVMRLDLDSTKAAFPSFSVESAQGSRCWFELNRKTVNRSDHSPGVSVPTFRFEFDLTDGQLGNIAALLGQARALHPQNPRYVFRGVPR